MRSNVDKKDSVIPAAPGAPRKWQVEVTLSTHGYLTVEAETEEAAAGKVREFEVPFNFAVDEFLDATLMDAFLDVHIDGVELDEPDPTDTEALS